ncbi:ketoacyl-ACP synthase III family protein [Streptomyces sp. PT12]|uniref:ketoacyl-ACP synthase III family protein n=1 Tax=Streptomyces sp. PT12 TaxID=1510197 RepID=UPI00215CF4AA|nr:ketoacyl-ACP synthase III family protein [Streptomyces sp. PT12]
MAARLGEPVPTSWAVADGRYDEEEAARSRQRAARVSARPAPDLAVAAGLAALARSGRPPTDIGLLLHANCYDQGVTFSNVASYIQREVLGHGDVTAMELRQMSNGGMCAIETAAIHLSAVPALRAALVTTGDRFAEPRFPRWSADKGLVFGDGGTAAVLSRRPGPLRLVATATYSAPELEGLHRGDDLHDPPEPGAPLDLAARKRAFLAGFPVAETITRNAEGMLTAVKRCVQDADGDVSDMAAVLVPFFGADLSHKQCVDPLGIGADDTLLDYGLDIGHLGSGDQVAGLAHLLGTGRLRPGQRALLVGVGAGFSWTCAVVEVTDEAAERADAAGEVGSA